MNKFLCYTIVLTLLLITNIGYSQSINTDSPLHVEGVFLSNPHLNHNVSKTFLNIDIKNHHLDEDHDHTHTISLLDIISSDEGADFNCSGGFCMIKSHFHKKGLTLKKQFFNYFMKIAC
ncbi:hypothetical protein [Aquimarina longa]|uniref:hypothetical protein n=1 Tax=Aquimarina longa TaxID=1080221 RepID=UPI0007805EC9|nr:hypothetical protein [Aquimarina longa]